MNLYFFKKLVFKFLKLIKRKDLEWKLNQRFPTVFFFPAMKWNEYWFFKQLCRDKKTFLEYGSGGSTIHLLKTGKQVYSVESNPEFYTFMKSINLVKEAIGKNLDFRYINLGPTNKWGKPTSSENDINWPQYYAKIWEDIDPSHKIDLIFIDGRFRICCCLYSILKVLEYNWTDTLIVIHDFWRRQKYHAVLPFLQEIKSASNLAAFRIKKNANVAEIEEKIQEYALVVA